ncbi:protein FAM227B-like [Protopterus annectens]|uniref:protein FAM227B-like n=1 Tax=Protopterus annectens TaxID=7888 RepID=UPI001CFB2D8F|nr:protein FAM227B-like [Protopterus annectens]
MQMPPNTVEDFLKIQAVEEWPRIFLDEEEFDLAKEDLGIYRSSDAISDYLLEISPFPAERLVTVGKRIDKCESLLEEYASKLFSNEQMLPMARETQLPTLQRIKPMPLSWKWNMKHLEKSGTQEKNVNENTIEPGKLNAGACRQIQCFSWVDYEITLFHLSNNVPPSIRLLKDTVSSK